MVPDNRETTHDKEEESTHQKAEDSAPHHCDPDRALAAAIGAFLLWWKFGKKDEVTESYATGPVYDSAVTTSIEQTYAATGKIAAGKEAGTGAAASTASSSDSTSATAAGTASLSSTDAADYPVKEVYVKVGDRVKKGDPLYALDMSELEDQIALNQKKLALQEKSNAIDDAAASTTMRRENSTRPHRMQTPRSWTP